LPPVTHRGSRGSAQRRTGSPSGLPSRYQQSLNIPCLGSEAAAASAVEKVQALFQELNNQNIVNFRYVHLWVEQGCDVDLDILPAIRETTRRQWMDSPDWLARELKYYDGAVHDWRRKRAAAPRIRLVERQLGYDPKEAIAAGIAAAEAKLKEYDP
jgi:hypothetical protein